MSVFHVPARKRLFVAATAMFFAATLATSVAAQEAAKPAWRQFCGAVGDLAFRVMQSRQAGVPMQTLMELPQKEGGDPIAPKIFYNMVVAAYQQPRFTTPTYVGYAINNFRDVQYLACVKTLNN